MAGLGDGDLDGCKCVRIQQRPYALEPGKLADLIIVNGNPLTNINDVMQVQCSAVNGELRSTDEIAAPFTSAVAKNSVCSK